MSVRFFASALAAAAALVIAVSGASAQGQQVVRSGHGFHVRVCDAPSDTDTARCHAELATDSTGHPLIKLLRPNTTGTLGAVPYSARDLWSAYYGSSTMPGPPVGTTAPATTPTVAVVDAYGYRNAASDLAKYRQVNGLPPLCSATVVTNCVRFTKLNQSGVPGLYPTNNNGWSQESALDIQMVSALCPYCNIVLVEANSASMGNLAAAEVTASKQSGVVAISNSYGGGETNTNNYSGYYAPTGTTTNGSQGKINPNVAITVSSGDGGYGVEFPASAPWVISVGGTSLTYSNSAWTQAAWSGAGSGCSAVYHQMSWQTAALPNPSNCTGRVVADVSAVADPNTGVGVVFGPYLYQFGGTSVSAPLIAGIIGQRNQPITQALNPDTTVAASYGLNLYTQKAALTDVTSGSNGSCGSSYLCTAVTGFDGPTGLGTPNGNLAPF